VLALERTAAPTPAPDRIASTVWRGLLSGAWALLDSFDHDDRWYLVARQRAAHEPHAPVSAREQQVLALAARGHANKYIGYELGLSAVDRGHPPAARARQARRAVARRAGRGRADGRAGLAAGDSSTK
jgi:hypothetical protein